ncbi:hypothetical protein ACJJTC_010284 [Scirpophaga incertulas]
MEDNSEAHMDTDVSSTTDDMPDTAEITGSNGDVEMVVIVEKVSDNEDNVREESKPEPLEAVTDNAEVKTISLRTCPKKILSPVLSKTPTKTNDIVKISEPKQNLQTPVKAINQLSNETEVVIVLPETSISSQPEETIDSSSKSINKKSSEKKELLEPENSVVLSIQKNLSQTTIDDTQDSSKLSSCGDIQPQQIDSVLENNGDIQLEENNTILNKNQLLEKPNNDGVTKKTITVEESNNESMDISQENIIEGNKDTTSQEIESTTKDGIRNDMDDIYDYSSLDGSLMFKETSNDSQTTDTNSDILEKEHNKSISRELKSLIMSAKESKIISECTQLTSKTRKSRTPLDISNTSTPTSEPVEAEKIKEKRRNSDNSNSQASTALSEKSDKNTVKRSMRSQNPEFVNKVKQFLNSVTSKVQKQSDEGIDEVIVCKTKDQKCDALASPPKKRKIADSGVQNKISKLRIDPYCWRCHWEIEVVSNEKTLPPMSCTVCPRAFHVKCLSSNERNQINQKKSWACPECMGILQAESSETRSPAMKKITLTTLRELLKHAVDRLLMLNGVEPFVHPVDNTVFPDYEKYVVHPMDLTLVRENIAAGRYGSTESFLADVQWILHNSIIFNTLQSKLTAAARTLVRSCRAEMGEIEACPECYAAAHAQNPTWFTDVCSTPHVLLGRNLRLVLTQRILVPKRYGYFGLPDRPPLNHLTTKTHTKQKHLNTISALVTYLFLSFPYWPAKGMSVNSNGLVDVRFFGAHDRAWVPSKDCYLYSEKDPNNFRTKRQDILDSMQIPSFEGEVILSAKQSKQSNASPAPVKEKSKSNLKSYKGYYYESYTSESEESASSNKATDGLTGPVRDETESSTEKDKAIDVDEQVVTKESRKRRRSQLQEAVITIIETSSNNEKKKRTEENNENSKRVSLPTPAVSELTNSENHDPIAEKVGIEPKNTTTTDVEKQAPIKLVISTSKTNKYVSKSSIKPAPEQVLPLKIKLNKSDIQKKDKEEKVKLSRRRSSKGNKSLNGDSTTNKSMDVSFSDKSLDTSGVNKSLNTSKTPKTEKSLEKRRNSAVNHSKSKSKNSNEISKNNSSFNKSLKLTETPSKPTNTPKTSKERQKIDDNISLAALARAVKNNAVNDDLIGMPTISSVRSLSRTSQNSKTTTKNTAVPKIVEVISIESSNDSVSSIESVKNVNNSGTKSQAQKSGNENSLVGRVGVRAFARMRSMDKTKDVNNGVTIEIKSEPIDVDEEAARHSEKMDLMSAFRLRPVNPPGSQEVRVNKVITTGVIAKKSVSKPLEIHSRARKTFPQAKKPDGEGRSDLNGKNSMVYIPIQPPTTPGPLRGARLAPLSVTNGPCTSTPVSRCITITTTCTNTTVNAVSTPASTNLQNLSNPNLRTTLHSNTSQLVSSVVVSNMGQISNISQLTGVVSKMGQVNTVGQVPTTVHTVPLITSVNGQWTFSLQPIMSVGADNDTPSPIVNGLSDGPSGSPLVPLLPTPGVGSNQTPLLIPAATSHMIQQPPIVTTASVSTVNSLTTQMSTPIANRTIDTVATPGEPPRLQPRPCLVNPFDDQNSASSTMPTPSSAGPITAKLNQHAIKMADFFRTLLVDSLEKINDPSSQIWAVKLQMEKLRWQYQQEIEELKHNHELTLTEVRLSYEKEKARLVNFTKSKMWCVRCKQEAYFYCCWNTAYCDLECQRAHWLQSHYNECLQNKPNNCEGNSDGSSTLSESRLQSQAGPSGTMPPVQAAPGLAVGGKVTGPRIITQESPALQKIIIGVDKDGAGSSKLKCVGSYNKTPTSNTSKLIINKQNDDGSHKVVVTSGGYLILGAPSNPSAPMASTSRRPHTIQYYT